jgi:hypothetical protein
VTIEEEWADRALWAENVVREYEEKIAALCDALTAERERVRVLRAALRDAMRYTHAVPMAAFDEWMDALAATDDGGGA